jgi:hypothetical protein
MTPPAKLMSSKTRPSGSGDPEPAVEGGRDHQPPAPRRSAERPLDLVAAKHALAPPPGAWAFVALEQLDRIAGDPAMAAGEAHHALERRQRACRRLR